MKYKIKTWNPALMMIQLSMAFVLGYFISNQFQATLIMKMYIL